MKKFTKILIVLTITFLGLVNFQTLTFAKDVGNTPYKHMPIDTFIAGFPLEALVFLGIFAYTIGAIYIFNAVLLKNKKN